MALLTQASLGLAGPTPAVLELGNQTLTANRAALELVVRRVREQGGEVGGLEAINALDETARRDRVAEFYRCLGARAYQAIDVNDTYGSLVMDLNQNLAEQYGFRETYQFVTNNGTGEHVFDQGAIYRNVHALTAPGGVMVHVMPFINYLNHGFYSYHPNLYYALAAANGYDLLALGVATRHGDGVIAAAGGFPEQGVLRHGCAVPLAWLVSDAKLPRRGWPRRWLDLALGRLPGATPAQRFGLTLDRLLVSGRKLLTFAVLRKDGDAPFQVPIQQRYEHAVAEELTRAGSQGAEHG